MDVLAGLRKLLRIEVTLETVTFRYEQASFNPYAEVSGLASFDPRERDRIRAELSRALGEPRARLKSVRFLDGSLD